MKNAVFFDSGSKISRYKANREINSKMANENMPERYLFVIDDFISMKKKQLLPSSNE